MKQLKTLLNRFHNKALDPATFRHPSEAWAAQWLQKQGLILLAHNYHSRFGEIDLIMQHGRDLVFIEVRYRNNQQSGYAAETIDRRKQQKLLKTAQHYLQAHGKTNSTCRFDVVSMDITAAKQPVCQWFQNAFGES